MSDVYRNGRYEPDDGVVLDADTASPLPDGARAGGTASPLPVGVSAGAAGDVADADADADADTRPVTDGADGADAATDTSPTSPGAKVLVPLLRWREEGKAIEAAAAAVGLLLSGDDPIEVVGEEVHRFPVIAIRFPAFTDGRGYSLARLLRERRRFAGELRAVGDVLADQIPLMWRCGFDALAVTHEPTRAALAAGRVAGLPLHMQPTGGSDPAPVAARPWLRATRPAHTPNFAGC
jgi:phosphoadenosine phosphosulfate reductase